MSTGMSPPARRLPTRWRQAILPDIRSAWAGNFTAAQRRRAGTLKGCGPFGTAQAQTAGARFFGAKFSWRSAVWQEKTVRVDSPRFLAAAGAENDRRGGPASVLPRHPPAAELTRQIVAALPDPVLCIARDGGLLHANPAARRLLATEAASILELLLPQDRERWLWQYARSCDGETAVGHFELAGRDGARHPVELRTAPLSLETGVTAVLATVHPAAYPASPAARPGPPLVPGQPPFGSAGSDSERLVRELLDALPVAIYTTDAAGRITFFNQAAVAFSGRVPELGTDSWCVTWRLYTPDGEPLPHGECPMALALREDRAIRGIEAVAERPDGTRVPFMPFPTPLHDDRGRMIGAVNMLVDLSEQKAAEEMLRRLNEMLEERVEERTRTAAHTLLQLHDTERRFRLLVQGVTDYAIFMLDPEGIITNWNAGAERIKGYHADEIIGRHFSRFYTAEDRRNGVPYRALQTAARTGKYEAEGWRVRKDGARFWASVVIDAIREEGGALIGFAKVTRDLTERRAVEEQLRQAQKMEAVGQLTGGVAHDFNNLLATIMPNLELALLRGPQRGAIRRYLETAMRAAERGAQLTHQLLAFSRRDEAAIGDVAVDRLIAETCEMLPRTIGPEIAIHSVLDPDTWPARTDAGELGVALLNLAINARDAMPAGGTLTITTRNMATGTTPRIPDLALGDYVAIEVRDTGSGMSETVRRRAFEPFFTTKEVGKGSGLGLSMVYTLVKRSGGTVTIDSEPGLGTAICLYLARARGAGGGTGETGRTEGCEAGPPSRILVVDDDDGVREGTATLVRNLGHEAVEAPTPETGLAILARDHGFDLLIVDLSMPRMQGAAFAAEARRRLPDTPILFVTGHVEADRLADLSAGQLLKKPFRQAELAEQLRRLLAGTARPC
jgi:PAS domain S-box-containing protein